jgi:hypothetical protein
LNWKGLRLMAATMLCLGVLYQPAFAQVAGDVNISPPPLQAEVIPPGPTGSIWIPGYWYWKDQHYEWVGGVWAEPRAGYFWVPASWEQRGQYYHFVAGRWEPLPPPERRVVISPPPPPPLPHEVVEVRPGYVWAPGYWYWDGFQYLWFAGVWGPEHHGPHGGGGPHWEGGPHGGGGPHGWR